MNHLMQSQVDPVAVAVDLLKNISEQTVALMSLAEAQKELKATVVSQAEKIFEDSRKLELELHDRLDVKIGKILDVSYNSKHAESNLARITEEARLLNNKLDQLIRESATNTDLIENRSSCQLIVGKVHTDIDQILQMLKGYYDLVQKIFEYQVKDKDFTKELASEKAKFDQKMIELKYTTRAKLTGQILGYLFGAGGLIILILEGAGII